MNELRQILDQQLSQLERQKELLEESIAEVRRRYAVLDDVDSWNLLAAQANGQEHPQHTGDEDQDPEVQDSHESELDPSLGWEIDGKQTFDSSGRPLRARDMFKRLSLSA